MKRLFVTSIFVMAPLWAAATIVPLSGSVDGAGTRTWSYEFELFDDATTRMLQPGIPPPGRSGLPYGSYLTLFDFAGYVTGSCKGPAGWVCTVQFVGDAADSGDGANLTWTYSSGPLLSALAGGLDLGLFSAQSVHGGTTALDYQAGSISQRSGRPGAVNSGRIAGPPALPVPEPSTLALGGLALALMVLPAHARRARMRTEPVRTRGRR